ncbi:hypothetical protein AB835_07625 [Candidatus Endobugula sertula]|uniref:Uncharacterized protein n=1 Tax=Candidatus Endobugula sertula TaxID=62101 RepID=A0A1D2QPZ5_9GAMM|nr:hypothetical protein AB835_07625 [Candidatus Endobugula sertula]
MIIGKSSIWRNSLIDIDKQVINCVERVWPKVIGRLTQREREDDITQRLVDLLRDDRVICQYGFLNIHFKLRKKDRAGDYTTKGILDMALFLDQDHEKYIAYECKRLNIVSDQGKRKASLAGAYVEEGVVRYVTAKYAEKLPYGCMLGYVMDGDIDFAFQQLNNAIKERKDLTCLETSRVALENSFFPRFETFHKRESCDPSFTVRHRLLSMV